MEVEAGEETTSTDIEPVTPVETPVTMETDETANVKPIQEDKEAGSVTTDTKKAAPSLIDYNILYRLLGSVKDNKSRAALCLLLKRVGHPAAEVLVKVKYYADVCVRHTSQKHICSLSSFSQSLDLKTLLRRHSSAVSEIICKTTAEK